MKLPDFQLERFFAKHEFKVQHLLCASDCEAMTIAELLQFEDGAEDRFKEVFLGYTESSGDPGLRRKISEIYKQITPNDVLVFAGAEEAIYLFMQGFLEKEDHAIVHAPCYQSLREVAAGTGAEIDDWRAQSDKQWALDLNTLEDLIKPNTKLIVINSPHNPTGYLMPRSDWEALHRIADKHGIVVFCDEVYRESEYDPQDRLPAGCEMSENAVSLGVMSKTYGLAGLRIGWVATRNKQIYKMLMSQKDYTTICNSAPSEFLAELALSHRENLVSRNLGIIGDNLQLIETFMEQHADRFEWHKPLAGAIAFPKWLGGNVEAFCNSLLEQSGVLLAPGHLFNDDGDHFRIGFGRQNFPEGLKELAAFLK